MLRSDLSQVLRFRAQRAAIAAVCRLAALAFIPSASAQTYTLGMNKFQPFAIAPSQTANASVVLSVPQGDSSPGPVNLTCSVEAVSPTSTTVDPQCQMSPPSVTPPGSANAVITTAFNETTATPGAYNVTVTGQFNLTVSTVLEPNSVPAGSGAQATIAVNPVNGYQGSVTLACQTVTPLVDFPPQCNFTYPGGLTSVPVQSGVPGLVTLTICTTKINQTTTCNNASVQVTQPPAIVHPHANSHNKLIYAMWIPGPMLALFGLGRKRWRRSFALLAVLCLGASILLIPACNTTTYNTPSTADKTTPNGTYTITLVGTDQSGNISTNTGTTATTLTLTVTAPGT